MMQTWDKSDFQLRHRCPGFCGRVILNKSEPDWVYSDCQPCPWGTQALEKFECNDCTYKLQGYDLAFIIFHAMTPLLINMMYIRSSTVGPKKQKLPRIWIFLQLLSAILECCSSFIFTLLSFKPVGSLSVYTCQSQSLHEWYPMLFNPLVNYTHTLRCTSEIVYPRYSLPFANLAFNLLTLIIFRSIVYIIGYFKSPMRIPSEPFYAVLWTLPIIGLFHAVLSGVIYYIFPYITLFASLILNAYHLAIEGRKNIKQILRIILKNPDHLLMVFIHMFLFGFAIFSLYLSLSYPSPKFETFLLIAALLPVPSLFYILTIKLTIPPRSGPRALR